MSKLNKDMPLTEQFQAVMERMREDRPPYDIQQANFMIALVIDVRYRKQKRKRSEVTHETNL